MANPEHLAILKQGVEVWNQWRKEHLEIRPNLREADLRGRKMRKANLQEVNLIRADLRWADLEGAILSKSSFYNANLCRANLRNAELQKAKLIGTDMSSADLSCADLSYANLSWANLSNSNLSGANLTGSRIYAVSAWNVKLEKTIQSGLIIAREGETDIIVDNLEVAQFIYLLLNHKKLRDVFNTMTERGVLILGRFGGGGLEVLQAIAARLREAKYLPVIFDFERPYDRTFTETVQTLAGLSRFIIADLSGPSVPQELYATVPHFKIPFVPIIEAGRKPFAISVDLLEYPWVVRPPVTFATIDELLEQLPTKVIAPAEEKHQARQKLLDELFNKT